MRVIRVHLGNRKGVKLPNQKNLWKQQIIENLYCLDAKDPKSLRTTNCREFSVRIKDGGKGGRCGGVPWRLQVSSPSSPPPLWWSSYHHHPHHHHCDGHHIIIILTISLTIIPITINVIVFPLLVGVASSLAFNRFLPAYRYSSSFPLLSRSILHLSLKNQDLEIQEKGDGNTGLMLASREGHLPIISLLLL